MVTTLETLYLECDELLLEAPPTEPTADTDRDPFQLQHVIPTQDARN